VALISALPELATSVGAPRVVRGVRIEHVCGDPSLPPAEDFALRCRLVARALEALETPVERPTVFEVAS
jgi:betaine reductase